VLQAWLKVTDCHVQRGWRNRQLPGRCLASPNGMLALL